MRSIERFLLGGVLGWLLLWASSYAWGGWDSKISSVQHAFERTRARVAGPAAAALAWANAQKQKATQPLNTVKKDIDKGVQAAQGATAQAFYEIEQAVSIPAATITNPYKGKVGSVSSLPTISQDEALARTNREAIVRVAMEKFFGKAALAAPTVAMCASGGGYRAMISTIGVMEGLEQTGLMDFITYFAALSGSTWALVPYLYWKHSGFGDLASFASNIELAVQRDLRDPDWEEFKHLYAQLQARSKFNTPSSSDALKNSFVRIFSKDFKTYVSRPTTSVDLWGLLIGNRLLNRWGSDRFNLYLSDLHDVVSAGSVPIPLCVASNRSVSNGSYEYFEFSPFEVGNYNGVKAFVPTWSLGNRFSGGTQLDFDPPMSLDFMLGTFGSAFALSLGDIVVNAPDGAKAMQDLFGEAAFKKIFSKGTLVEGADIFNPFFRYSFAPSNVSQFSILNLVDGAFGGNLPYAPLVSRKRNVDVIIVCDFSATIAGVPELKGAYDYAQKNNVSKVHDYRARPGDYYPFPSVSRAQWRNADKANITVFKGDKSRNIPTIVYIPFLKNSSLSGESGLFDPAQALQSFAGTLNFVYTAEQFNELKNYWKDTIVRMKDEILNAIRQHMSF